MSLLEAEKRLAALDRYIQIVVGVQREIDSSTASIATDMAAILILRFLDQGILAPGPNWEEE